MALQTGFRPIPVLNAHQVWFTPDLSRKIFITFNLPEGKAHAPEGDLFPLNSSDSMIYLRDRNQRRYSVIFASIPGEVAQNIARDLKRRINQSPPVLESFANLLVPSASAASGACTPGEGMAGLTDFHRMVEKAGSELGAGVRAAWACFQGQLKGIWDATGGTVVSMVEGAYQLVTRPVESWSSMKTAFSHFVDFIKTFQQSMAQVGRAIATLPLEDQAELLCSFLASIGTDVAIAVLTVGAGSPLVAKELMTFTKRLVGLEKFFSGISKLGRLREVLGERFMALFAKGAISAERIETIEALSDNGLIDIAREAALCGI